MKGKIRYSGCRLTGSEHAPLLLYNYSNAEVVFNYVRFSKTHHYIECDLDEHSSGKFYVRMTVHLL
jgi:hypothetical protein